MPVAPLPELDHLLPLSGKRVLLRADLNVPLTLEDTGNGHVRATVADEFRIMATLPTIRWLEEHGAKVVVASHLGRPEGHFDERYVMAPVAAVLAELAPGVEVLENLRFDPGEESNDPRFVQELVAGNDAYVNDAFGVCHRAHASIVGPPEFLPSAAGFQLQSEVKALGALLDHPMRPFVAVVGGAKVHDKLGVLCALADHVDSLVIGGGMAFSFLAALGHSVGASLVEQSELEACAGLLERHKRVLLPLDVVALAPGGKPVGAASGLRAADEEVKIFGPDLPEGWQGLDIGPETCDAYADEISEAGTVFWNGPMGVFEDLRFAGGTLAVARAVAGAKGFTVAGGGDTVSALDHLGMRTSIGFVSTGGGASLELLEHGDLPGLAALRR